MADFADHVGEVFVVDAADPAQGCEVAPGQQLEMLDQRLHRRIVAVLLAQLDRKAFAQIAGADAGRIESLQHRENGCDVARAGAELVADVAEIGWQVTGLVDEIDQILSNHALRRRGDGDRELFGQMFAERHLGRDEGLEIVAHRHSRRRRPIP